MAQNILGGICKNWGDDCEEDGADQAGKEKEEGVQLVWKEITVKKIDLAGVISGVSLKQPEIKVGPKDEPIK